MTEHPNPKLVSAFAEMRSAHDRALKRAVSVIISEIAFKANKSSDPNLRRVYVCKGKDRIFMDVHFIMDDYLYRVIRLAKESDDHHRKLSDALCPYGIRISNLHEIGLTYKAHHVHNNRTYFGTSGFIAYIFDLDW